MINDILQKDTIKADLGFGVDYYKGEPGKNGEDGKTPIKGVDYFTQTEIQQIEDNAAAKVDLSDYAKSADLSTVATSGSYNDLVDKPTIPSVEGLASEIYVDTKVAAIKIPTVPTKVSAFTNDAGYLTEHQDLTSYAKKSEIPTVPTKLSQLTDDVGYLTEHQDLTSYAKKTEIPTVPTKVSAFENDKGYLTSHQSLADYSTTAQVQTMINNAIGAIENGTY